jgi:hypothetical protein
MANSRERLEKLSSGFMEARIMITAAELDIFSAIGGRERTAAEVAGELGLHAPSTERLLNALTAMKLLAKRRGRFRNTRAALEHLTSDSPEPLGDIMRHRGGMWERWSKLTSIVRTGRVPVCKRTAERTEHFIKGMSNVAALSAVEAAGALARELRKTKRFLDVGGGPGSYACVFAQKYPGLRATLADLPDVLAIARETVQAAGLQKRVTLKECDLLTPAPLGRGFDLALLSNVVHSFKPKDAAAVIARTAAAVRRGGHVAVKEFCLEKDGTAPHFAALFSINMLVAEAGDSYPAGQLREWMADAGLGRFRQVPLAKASTLIVGQRL